LTPWHSHVVTKVPSRFRFEDAGYAAILRISTDTPNGEVASGVRLERQRLPGGAERVEVVFFGPDRERAREIRKILRDEPERLRFVDSQGARVEITPITLAWWRAHGRAACGSDFEPGGDTDTDLQKLRNYVAHGGVPT
jgi:hypothetical protein